MLLFKIFLLVSMMMISFFSFSQDTNVLTPPIAVLKDKLISDKLPIVNDNTIREVIANNLNESDLIFLLNSMPKKIYESFDSNFNISSQSDARQLFLIKLMMQEVFVQSQFFNSPKVLDCYAVVMTMYNSKETNGSFPSTPCLGRLSNFKSSSKDSDLFKKIDTYLIEKMMNSIRKKL
jgi:hypothetical protein